MVNLHCNCLCHASDTIVEENLALRVRSRQQETAQSYLMCSDLKRSENLCLHAIVSANNIHQGAFH